MKYRTEIDGLRTVAVVPVILFHAGFSLFSGGYVGVDIFFVISGFLITSIIIKELDQGTFSIVNFYERRARRILPALFFVIAVSLPFAWMLLVPQDMKDFGQSLTAVALFSSNILFWSESGYFAAASELKPLLHTWSLAVEEQYYILFPLLLMVTWRWGVKITLVGLVVIFVISLFLAQVIVSKDASFAFYMLPTRAWELLAGSFVAFALYRFPTLPRAGWVAQTGSLIGLVLVLYAIFVFDARTPFPSLYTVVPVLGASLIILCTRQGTLVHALLSTRGFVGIGLISYSTYLWHQPLFALTRYSYASHPPVAIMVGLIIASLVLAYCSWRWIEGPFRVKGRVTRTQIFSLSGAGITGLMTLGVVAHFQDGLPTRFTPLQQELFASVSASPKRGACHNIALPENACTYFVDTPTWAVFGDSHAVEMAYGLASKLRPYNKGVTHFSFSGCGPKSSTSATDGCSQWAERSLEYLLANDTIDTVVVTYRIAAYLSGKHEDIYPDQPNLISAAERAQVWDNYIKTLKTFVDQGKTVHLVLLAPEVPTHINQMIRRTASEPDAPSAFWLPGVSRVWWDARMAYVTDRLDEIPIAVHIHNPTATFCDETSCYLAQGDKVLYFDDDHMSVTGATIIADQIVNGPQL